MHINISSRRHNIMHIFSAVSAAVLLIAGFIILAHLSPKVFADTEGAYTFTINSGEATIDEYDADIGGVNPVIPNSLGGVPVVAVGNNAFEGKNLESVSLPSMLETIGDLAFAGNSLESITFPSGLESIGQLAFVANQLEAVVLPNSVTTVSSQAFMQNSITSVTLSTSMTVVDEMVFSGNSITSFTIPSHITEIKQYAFAENLMTSIAIPSTLQTLEGFAFNDSPITNVQVGTSGSNQNILLKSFSLSDLPIETIEFNGDNVTLESYTLSSIGSSPSIDVSFNEGTLVLGNYAFDNPAAAIVRSIVISPNVTSLQIGNYAFRNASLLESFAVPDGVPTTIGEYAFNSAGIKQLHIGDSVTSIGESAFDNTPLETLDIKEGIETIGQWAFGWSSGGAGTSPVLESVVIPNSVTTLGQFPLGYRTVRSLSIGTPDFTGTPLISISPASFSDSGIEELTIGGIVASIDAYAFGGANSLTHVTIPNSVTYLGGSMFDGSPLESLQIGTTDFAGTPSLVISSGFMAGANTLKSLLLGNNVLTIESSAFAANLLEDITIPASVTSIGAAAFADNNLQTVTILGDPTLEAGVFVSNGLDKATVPTGLTADETLQYYQENAQLVRLYAKDSDSEIAGLLGSIMSELDSLGNRYVTSGYVINPSSVLFTFKDGDGNDLAPQEYYTGYDSSTDTYISDYAITNGLDTTDPDNPTIDFMMYFRDGDTYTITPPDVAGYVTPDPMTYTLGDGGVEIQNFVYATIDDGDNSGGDSQPDNDTPGVPNTGILSNLESNWSALISLALVAVGSSITATAFYLKNRYNK